MTTCVVDANVAAKWLLPAAGEDLLDQANHLLARHIRRELQLLAPDLIEAELGNVLWKAVRHNRINPLDAQNALRHFASLSVQIVPTSDLLLPALQIAVSCNVSFYDSLYVVLAVASNTELVTADERLVNTLGSRFPVRWLGVF